MIYNAAMQMQQMMGYRPQLSQEEVDNLKEENRPMAEEQVRGGLLLMEVTKAAEIEVSEEDVEAEIENLCESSGQADQVKAHFKNPQERQNLKYRPMEDRTVDAILKRRLGLSRSQGKSQRPLNNSFRSHVLISVNLLVRRGPCALARIESKPILWFVLINLSRSKSYHEQ